VSLTLEKNSKTVKASLTGGVDTGDKFLIEISMTPAMHAWFVSLTPVMHKNNLIIL
jgi:hypothetical protein